MRVSYDDDELSIDQILAFVSNLKVEQICITASALLDHYTRASLITETPHAEDIAGIQAILELINKLAVQPQADPPTVQAFGSEACQSMTTTEYSPPCLDFSRTPHASSSYHIADDSEGSQHPRPAKREFNADIDIDV